jgi:hypothetical protein
MVVTDANEYSVSPPMFIGTHSSVAEYLVTWSFGKSLQTNHVSLNLTPVNAYYVVFEISLCKVQSHCEV